MKLEDLLHFHVEEVEKLTPAQLTELCKPFWNVTRPDPAKIKEMQAQAASNINTRTKNANASKGKAIQQGLALMEQYKHLLK